ncbi:FliA/WhiG family RNA polymerase sigma factor, partial [Cellulomonas rhizosphaerae]
MTTTQVDAAAAWLAHVGADAAPAGVVPQPRNLQADGAVDAELGSLVEAPEIPTQRAPLADEAAAALALLWVDLKDKGCATARQNLILHYAPLVAAVAGR